MLAHEFGMDDGTVAAVRVSDQPGYGCLVLRYTDIQAVRGIRRKGESDDARSGTEYRLLLEELRLYDRIGLVEHKSIPRFLNIRFKY